MSFDLQRLRTCTYASKQAVDRARRNLARLECDADRAERLKERECLCCFYLRGTRLAGQGFTEWSCLSCGAKDMHGNTSVPHYCVGCADKMRICTRCGGDQELEVRKAVLVAKSKRRR